MYKVLINSLYAAQDLTSYKVNDKLVNIEEYLAAKIKYLLIPL